MTIRRWIWIDGVRHNFEELSDEKKEECAIKMQLQVLRSQGREPTDEWLEDNPIYQEHWDRIKGVEM